MQWLTDLVALLGTSRATANAAEALAEEREAADRVERFLARFDHPAGRATTPVEPAYPSASSVA